MLKISNNDAMLLAASNIASEAYGDYSNQNQSEILRFSKNLDFRQFLKMEFEPHICCHENDLSNITNWQHIGKGASVATNQQQMLPPPCLISQFSFVVSIFFIY